MDAVREHAGVLAGAIVRERRPRRWRRDFAAHVEVAGWVRTALQLVGTAADARQHVRDRGSVSWLAGMTGTHQRELRLRKAEACGATRCNQRHGLKRLERAARHGEEVRVAGGGEERSIAVDHGDGTVMHAL